MRDEVNNDRIQRACLREKPTTRKQESWIMVLGVIAATGVLFC